jgi:hypothetical protein
VVRLARPVGDTGVLQINFLMNFSLHTVINDIFRTAHDGGLASNLLLFAEEKTVILKSEVTSFPTL